MFIQGEEFYGEEIIAFLSITGENKYKLQGNNPDFVYGVENGVIVSYGKEFFENKYTTWYYISNTTTPWHTKLSNIKGWGPSNPHITSIHDKSFITSYFQLRELSSSDLQNLRDMTVMWYTMIVQYERESNGTEMDRYIRAMQSITSIIDQYIYETK